MADLWNPEQYGRYRDERSRPFHDLLGLVEPREAMRLVDLGCGDGALTRLAHERLSASATLGVDLSEAMLASARAHADPPRLRFEPGDLGRFEADGAYDLVLSNAAIHWVKDHAGLFARLSRALAPAGQLAIQLPANHEHASHRAADAVAAEEPFRSALGGYQRGATALRPTGYAEVLHRLGFAAQRVYLEVYPHQLGSREDVIEWVRGSLLTDYQGRLGAELYARFLARYRERLFALLPDARPFLYTYDRIFIWGRRPA
jgi:trans-aconitate 2-methyltransferase